MQPALHRQDFKLSNTIRCRFSPEVRSTDLREQQRKEIAMKHFKLFVLLLALLATASIMYGQRKSSTALQPQQNSTYSTTSNSGSSWTCPMWGWWGPRGNQARTSSGSVWTNGSWHDVRPVELWPVWADGAGDDVLRSHESCSGSAWQCQVRLRWTTAVAIRQIIRAEFWGAAARLLPKTVLRTLRG